MDFFNELLRIFNLKMDIPKPYGWFHLLFCALSLLTAVILCATHKKGDDRRVRRVVFITAVLVAVLEIYKQINYSFSYGDAITFDYQWYAFPWQFCSMPMYVGLLVGLTRKGKVHNALCAFLATYAVFAGACVMAYPNDVFITTIGVNIQTMICHGSMITVGIYLLYTQYVKLSHKTILSAMSVFAVAIALAITLNEIVYHTGITDGESFNMFYISPHAASTLPVYSSVQKAVAYPWCLLIYFITFTLVAYVILILAMAIKALCGRHTKAE